MNTPSPSPAHSLDLTGLNGQNPLAFLAALGALRTATRLASTSNSTATNAPSTRPIYLSWKPLKNGWYPTLSGTANFLKSPDEISAAFHEILAKENSALTLSTDPKKPVNNPKIQASDFRICAQNAAENWLDNSAPENAAFIAALGNESVIDKDGLSEDTAFRTMNGAGHQHFLKTMRELIANTGNTQLHEALFGPWKYSDKRLSLRWSPEEDRRYALRWKDPSGDTILNVRGANRLAIEALPLFPTIPTSRTLETTGFTQFKNTQKNTLNGTFFTYPIWTTPLTLDVCLSLLAHSELQKEKPNTLLLSSIGVSAIFRTQRITIGKFRNFTPSQSIL